MDEAMSEGQPRVLVAERDDVTRRLIEAALAGAGYAVTSVACGEIAVRDFWSPPCDMALLAVDLPGLDGFQVCAHLRQDAGPELPVLLLASAHDAASIERGFEAGATDFVARPVNPVLIVQRVRHLMRGFRHLKRLRFSEQRLNEAQRLARIGHWELDLLRNRLTWSGEIYRIFEIDPSRFAASYEAFLDAIHPHDREAVNAAYQRSLQTRTPYEISHRLLLPGGRIKYVHERCETTFDDQGRALVSIGTVQDVTERKLQELEVVAARNQLKDTLEAIPDLLCESDLDGMLLHVQIPKLMSLPPGYDALLGRRVSELLPAEGSDVCLTALREAWETGSSHGAQVCVPLPRGERWFELAVSRKSAMGGDAPRLIVLARDISDRKEAEQKIARLAYFDTLTGLPNRPSFADQLDTEIARAREHGEQLAVVLLDLDGFKNVNDTLGHDTGDLLLKWVAERMRTTLRSGDLVARAELGSRQPVALARQGGDEFTVLLPHLQDSDDVLAVLHRIGAQLRRPFMLGDREVALTASMGVALFPQDGEDAATLLKHADTAMYHAKRSGRDNCQFYSATLTQAAVRRLELESDLRLALEKQAFFLEYQPQLDLRTGRLQGVEALIRWRHPEKGLISPMEFIPAAEENGLIVPIGDWVLRTACGDAARWAADGVPLKVAVNVSARQLKVPDLPARIGSILERAGLPAHGLELEVTEGVLMEDTEATLATLDGLRRLGVGISLDDFGTGFSSLSYLKRLPLSNLKVDRSFVSGLPDDQDSLAIVHAIVSLARHLGFTVTAEGIETLAQARILRDLSCEFLQGYYIARPVPAEQIPALVARACPSETRTGAMLDTDDGQGLRMIRP